MLPFQLSNISSPTAVIAGTFELGTEFWLQRNAAARLIAVSLGATQRKFTDRLEFIKLYNDTCLSVGIDSRWCDLQGATATLYKTYLADHEQTWRSWKSGICERLTESDMRLQMQHMTGTKRAMETTGYDIFWDAFGAEIPKMERQQPVSPTRNLKSSPQASHDVPWSGVIFDMVNSVRSPTTRIYELLQKVVAPLGFKLLQLRLVDDFGFGIQLESQIRLGYFANRLGLESKAGKAAPLNLPSANDYRKLASMAMDELNIQVFPEISISTNAGGWVHSGFASLCPHHFCEKGRGVTTDVADPSFLPVVYSVLKELRSVFNRTSFFHLGHDERQSALDGCLRESLTSTEASSVAFSEFEEKLALFTDMLGISQNDILRWHNQEHKRYGGRTGNITHYRVQPDAELPKVNPGENFFVSVDLMYGDTWGIFKQTVSLLKLKPEGILGEIRDISEDGWEDKNLNLRLVAFSMGLQGKHEMSGKDAFTKALVKACKAAKLDGCDRSDGAEVSLSFEVEKSDYKDRMCSEFTYNVVGRTPRKSMTIEL